MSGWHTIVSEGCSRNSIQRQYQQLCRAHMLNLKAFDTIGRIGSLYNGWSNEFLRCEMTDNHSIDISMKGCSSKCELIPSSEGYRSFLQLLKIGNDQKLTLLLGGNSVSSPLLKFVEDQTQSITNGAKFLHYQYIHRKETLSSKCNSFDLTTLDSLLRMNLNATHIVTSVTWGVELIFIVQLSQNDEVKSQRTKQVLEKVRSFLNQSTTECRLTSDEIQLWSELDIKHYWHGASDLPEISMIDKILTALDGYEHRPDAYVPLAYGLSPIYLYTRDRELKKRVTYPLDSQLFDQLSERLCKIADAHASLHTILHDIPSALPSTQLKATIMKAYKSMEQIGCTRASFVSNLRAISIAIRRGDKQSNDFLTEFKHSKYDCLKRAPFDSLLHMCNGLRRKALMIHELQRQNVDYINLADHTLGNKCLHQADWESILQKLGAEYDFVRISFYCSSDELSNIDSDEKAWSLPKTVLQACSKGQKNSDMRIFYVDFSFCQHCMLETSIFTYRRPMQELNVLILGESGVGKSTFINAFVNYLAFDTLDQAQVAGTPVVLIPVAFLMTNNETFQNTLIKLGEPDGNENHEHPGESVTQQCKTYVLNISSCLKLRLIDTPGIGDTRGLQQDELNMQHIFRYVNNLECINAICILLKPNITRLNILFRSCISQLFNYLTAEARNNIVFCFTNSRSTLFSPGNTGPLLQEMLGSLAIPNIPFSPKNTFFFDSESFRYLAAIGQSIPFNDYERDQCEKSWTRSVKEATRLLHFVKTMQAYPIGKWHSRKHAELEIKMLARPIMEALRNILYNRAIQLHLHSKKTIQLNPKPIIGSAAVCNGPCIPTTVICRAGLWMAVDDFHHCTRSDASTSCSKCQCPSKDHMPVDYVLKYEERIYSKSVLQQPNHYSDLENCCIVFMAFEKSSEDLFFIWLDRFIDEEDYICRNHVDTTLNSTVRKSLEELKNKLIEEIEMMGFNHCATSTNQRLENVYDWINWIRKIPYVQEQVRVIQEGWTAICSKQECQVPIFPTKNNT